jgi:hypothetical protein
VPSQRRIKGFMGCSAEAGRASVRDGLESEDLDIVPIVSTVVLRL